MCLYVSNLFSKKNLAAFRVWWRTMMVNDGLWMLMASFIISFNRVLHPIILKYLDEYRQVKIEKLAPGRYASIFLLLLSDNSPKSTAKALFQAIIHKLHNAIDQLKRSILAVQIPRVPVLQVQIFNRNAKNSQPAWKQLPHNSPTHKPQYKKNRK